MKQKAIDLEDVLERVQDDWELLLELFDIFVDDYQVKRSMLADFVANKDFDKVRDIGHSLKGASGNISAKSLFGSFLKLEKLGEAHNPDGMEELLKTIDQQFVELKAAIEQIKKDYKTR